MAKRRKPWLKYKNPVKPAREYVPVKLKPRTFGLALFYLIFGGAIGGHKFYLGKMRQGGLLVLCYFMVTAIAAYMSSIYPNAEKAIILYFLLIILLEYRTLKNEVKLRNIELGYDV